MKTILLTGATGLIGSRFREMHGEDDLLLVSRSLGKDVLDLNVDDLVGIKTVLHLAASLGVKKSWEDPVGFYRNNVLATVHLANIAAKAGVEEFIYTSSLCAYEPQSSPYAGSKLCGEIAIEAFSDKMAVESLSLANIYGPQTRASSPQVISIFAKKIAQGDPVDVYGNARRDYTYIDDVVLILDRLIGHVCRDCEKYGWEVGTGVLTSTSDLALLVGKVMDKPVVVNYHEAVDEAGDTVDADNNWAKETLGREFTSLEEGIKEVVKNVAL